MMIDERKLRSQMALYDMTQERLCEKLDISTKTLRSWIKKGVIGSDYIEKISKELSISNPMPIFFADWVS